MLNTSGFAWNDVKKCIKVDSDDAWKTYVHVCFQPNFKFLLSLSSWMHMLYLFIIETC